MKKQVLVFLFCSLPFLCFLQENQDPLVEQCNLMDLMDLNSTTNDSILILDSVKWVIFESYSFPETSAFRGNIVSKRDTVINELAYKIIGWENTLDDYAIRVDSASKVYVIYLNRLQNYSTENDSTYIESESAWFYRLSNDSSEYLLYDFSLAENDTISLYFPPFTEGPNVPVLGGTFKFKVFSVFEYDIDVNCVSDSIVKAIDLLCVEEDPENSNMPYDIQISPWVLRIGAIEGGPIYTETSGFFESTPARINKVYFKEKLIYPCSLDDIITPKEVQVSIYPNPFNEYITIESTEDIVSLEIIDIYGKIILSMNDILLDRYTTQVSFKSGVYIVRVELVNSEIYVNHLIKM